MEEWIKWAIELQSIAQVGLTYTKDDFDKERFQRIREISAEIMSHQSEIPLEKVKDLFCNEEGYQTPKIDTRAVIFKEDKILLVKEKSCGEWALPGGWMDVDQSLKSNLIKEVEEEAGLNINPERILAVLDRKKHNSPPYPYGVCKIFVQCTLLSGEFKENIEISESGFFKKEELPTLSQSRNTKEQIEMCFEASKSKKWEAIFD